MRNRLHKFLQHVIRLAIHYNTKKLWELLVHAFYKIYMESTALLFNSILYFLLMVSGDNAFQDFAAVDELMDAVKQLAAKPKQEDTLFTIHFKKHIKRTLVFWQYGDLTLSKAPAKSRGADAFDTCYSESARMKLASYTDCDQFQKFYTHPLYEVDGQVTFLSIKQHHNKHIKT
ncbi:hypothetical protein CIRG_06379 [Coccidioides immitis RMSCC 2394]|uniref:Uncharacterized protein n=1 Tax=Coccidioides immitis RMSCC 2394 TaxID=404692 RepID=A0A0J6YIF6_COCIT|nr:hypothetical protein CIRG_06379 [Coccidioides immitis RMSCC 2394]